ncbi:MULTISPECIES: UvrD-helicase domain-containing protein [unclassified Synechococcus]|uniref:UvrD-helicase domain-containing protein n=1 Tax=unclassified Synechococcus TaxID=2626047 RepID=UPI0021A94348|nr:MULTISPECIES: UvrD-helicase domain-containing protein [unclassified Synechococcus]MCT0212744.1 UvrD-helicase domain-containing protein [Synechococcus sp. CS-1326]MCT0233752.1 UvrD-helicase domain-containing protein [Synechococcus sp. CS-1327]
MPWDDNLDRESPSFLLASSDAHVIRSLAGPGSGKSFAIKRRIARLMETGVPPEEILAITFTRTSAADLRNEIATIESAGAEKVVARTLHSHAMQMLLRQEAQELLDRRPRIIIEHELSPAFRDIQIPDGHDVRKKKELVASFVSGWATLQSDQPGYARDLDEQEFEDALVSWLKEHGALLVGEVIPLALRYLRNNPASPEIGKYQAILVDEYQDLNKSEQEFIRLFRGGSDIVIVGDDDQSIYSFKFAHPEGIRSIDVTFGDFTDVTFDTIRRCPKKVTEMASALISKNPNRSLGSLQAYAQNQDGIVQIVQWGDDRKEIDGLAEIIQREIASGLLIR